MNFKTILADLYLEFFNNYLTRRHFAEHYNISEPEAELLLRLGRDFHEQRVAELKGEVQ